MLDQAAELVDVTVVEGELHGFASLRAQRQLVEAVVPWLARLSPAPAGRSSGRA
jgi:hypothetical protein